MSKKNKKSKSMAVQPKAKSKILRKALKYIIGVAVLPAIFGTIYWAVIMFVLTQTDDASNDRNIVAYNVLGINKIDMVCPDGNNPDGTYAQFAFDTGAGNLITRSTLDELRKRGYHVTEFFWPIFGNSASNGSHFFPMACFVDFPYKARSVDIKSKGKTKTITTQETTIRRVYFQIGSDNLLGRDFMNHFYSEFTGDREVLLLHHSMPEGYNTKVDLIIRNYYQGSFYSGNGRPYWKLPLNGVMHEFYIDTGRSAIIDSLCMGMFAPYSEYNGNQPAKEFHGTDIGGSLKSSYCNWDSCIFSVGEQRIYADVLYEQGSPRSPYAVNPLYVHTEDGELFDILFDFSHHALYLKNE